MNPESRNPAPVPGTGLRVDLGLGGSCDPRNDSANNREPQAWASARELEHRSRTIARTALTLRGADRFNALGLASVYAVASAALVSGGAA